MAKIKAKRNFPKMLVPALSSRGRAVVIGIKDHFMNPPPPVDPNALMNALNDLDAKQTDYLDGGKKAREALVKARGVVVKMLDDLANHVETYCKQDMMIFLSSGFEAKSTTKAVALQPDPPTLESVTQGGTGQGIAQIKPVKGARSYVIQYGPLGPGGTPPTAWSSTPAVKSRPATKINGLTPGTTYAFQVRALGHEGYTDWSPSVTRMII